MPDLKIGPSMRVFLILAAALAVFPLRASAVDSNAASVTLSASVLQSISVSTGAVGTVNFSLLPGAAATGTPTIPLTTSWNLNPGLVGSVTLYAYFASSTAALTDGTDNIASADVLGSVNTGAFAAFTGTGPFGAGGASLSLFTEAITGANKIKTRNDNLDVQLDLTSLPNLPASTYTGTLLIQARAL